MRKASINVPIALIIPIIFSAGLALAVPAFSPAQAPAPIAAELDQILSSVFKPDQPGAALLIMKDGQVLVRKAYGLADLELGVPLSRDFFFLKDSRNRVEFTRDAGGRPVEVRMTGGFGPEAKYVRTAK
ncbi:MAG: hypothetical protein FJY82_03255 [Candidatus Aminicenantes bacterium]|nr:hypothetical protein [Candidatus Aminicenantes bacterium]